MTHDTKKHLRKSIRLKGRDYAALGAYFLTICAWNRQCVFGNIVSGRPQLNPLGEIVREEWLRTVQIRPDIAVDAFVVMPNHIHGILIIKCRGTLQRAPTHEAFGKPVSNSISTIVRLFKSTITKRINELHKTPGEPVWQRNYYEHIIRNEKELNLVREYIANNPLQWDLDRENPIGSGAAAKPPLRRINRGSFDLIYHAPQG